MMNAPNVPLLLFAAAFVALFAVMAALVIARTVRTSRAHRATLERLGFVPCEAERDALRERIERLENNAGYRYTIERPVRALLERDPVYFYRKLRRRGQSNAFATDEFLVPLRRPRPDPLVLYLKPSSLTEGLSTRLIRRLATADWDAQVDDVVKLELPAELAESNVLGALGPPGTHLHQLLSPGQMVRLLQAGDRGLYIITCRGDDCTLATPSGQTNLDLDRVWAFISDLVAAD